MLKKNTLAAELVAKFESRARRDDDGCLIWLGATVSDSDVGRVFIAGHAHRLPLLLHQLRRGRALAPGLVMRNTCGHSRCINDKHWEAVTIKRLRSEQRPSRGVKHQTAIALSRRRQSKLTIEDVRAIRASSETLVECARRYGVSVSTISHIRLRRTWREPNPFSGLS